jgi:hypothetical protein
MHEKSVIDQIEKFYENEKNQVIQGIKTQSNNILVEDRQ